MYQGRKFNSKKENVTGENGTYLGIQRFRFYIKCTACSQPVSFLTDPKNADYEMESGATRNYELSKDKKESEETATLEQEVEEKEDALKGLENRVLASQREMMDMDNLEEIKAMNMRHVKLLNSSGSAFDASAVLEARARNKMQLERLKLEDTIDDKGLTEEDENLVKSIQFGQTMTIKRLDDDDEIALELKRKHQAMMFEKQREEFKAKTRTPTMPLITAKRRRVNPMVVLATKADGPSEGLGSILGVYGSDSDSN